MTRRRIDWPFVLFWAVALLGCGAFWFFAVRWTVAFYGWLS